MPMSSRRLFLSLLLLPLPNLVAHADPSPISRAFQVQAVVANGCAFGTAISNNAYDLGTLSFGTPATWPVRLTSPAAPGPAPSS